MDAMTVVAGSRAAFTRMNLRSNALAYAGDVEGWRREPQ